VLLLVSDANVLIDVKAGDLLAPMFSLNYEFGVPDILFQYELRERHADFLSMGLQTIALSELVVAVADSYAEKHTKPSRMDVFALALAKDRQCPLLTGDAALRKAAEIEQVPVMGTVWLLQQMLQQKRITVAVARAAVDKMRLEGSRLPWHKLEIMFGTFESDIR